MPPRGFVLRRHPSVRLARQISDVCSILAEIAASVRLADGRGGEGLVLRGVLLGLLVLLGRLELWLGRGR